MRILSIRGGETSLMDERSYRDGSVGGVGEVTLHEYLIKFPDVIPGEQIDPDDPVKLLPIRSEAGVTAGSMDVLMVDQNGVLTVFEAKLIDNREIRRSVMAQGLEYLAHLSTEWDAARVINEGKAFYAGRGGELLAAAQQKLDPEQPFEQLCQSRLGLDVEELADRITRSLGDGRLRLIIVGDEIPSTLRTLLEFLNEAASFDVFGLEIRLFAQDADHQLLVPHLVGGTAKAQQKQGPRGRWDEPSFFRRLEEEAPESVGLARRLLDFGQRVTGRPVDWGTGKEKGSFTARLVTRDGARYSLFSVYTSGGFSVNFGWNGDRVAEDESERLRLLTNETLGVDFNERVWRAGWPEAPLERVQSKEAGFVKLVSDFVALKRD